MDGKGIRTLFSRNIRIFRDRRNWSQANLAEFAGVSINYIGDIERGKKWPHPDVLFKLTEALGIKVYELFLEENMDVSIDNQVLMQRFLNDVSLSLNKSLSLSVRQSIENIQKQYKLGKDNGLLRDNVFTDNQD